MNIGRYIMMGALIAMIVLTIVFTTDNEKSLEEINQEIVTVSGMENLEEKGDAELKEYYGFSRDDVEEYYLYGPETSTDATEVFLVKGKDKEQIETIRKAAEYRLQTQKKAFAKSNDTQKQYLENALICERGNFLLMAVGENAADLEDVFREVVRK